MKRVVAVVGLMLALGLALATTGPYTLNAHPGRTIQVFPADIRAVEEPAIRQADLAFARAGTAKDLERVLAFYADDASQLPPNAPMAVGKEAIRAFWAELLAKPGFAVSWQPTKVEASRGGDLGYSVGTYELTTTDAQGRPVTDQGKYMTAWRKHLDGTWKVVADSFNSNLPLPTTAMR